MFSLGKCITNNNPIRFRFWIGQPTVIDGKIVVKSGLLDSASSEVRFTRPAQVGSEEEDISGLLWSARGHLTGHPCKEPGIECEFWH